MMNNNINRIRMKIILLTVLIIGLEKSTWAADYYVMPSDACTYNGNGASPTCAGSAGAVGAWKGFSNIAWNSVKGNTFNLIGGQTYKERLNINADTNNPTGENQRMRISVYGSGPATIDSENGLRAGVYVYNGNYTTIDGVRGDAVNSDTNYGIRVINLGPYGSSGSYCWYCNGGSCTHNIITHLECYGSGNLGGLDNSQGTIYNSGGVPFETSYVWIHGPAAGHADDSQRWNMSGYYLGHTGLDVGCTTDCYDRIKIHHGKIDSLVEDGMDVGSHVSVYNMDISYLGYGDSHSDAIAFNTSRYAKAYNNYIHDHAGQGIYLDSIGDATNYIQQDVYVFNNVFARVGIGIPIDSEGLGHQTFINNAWILNNTFYDMIGLSVGYGARGEGTGCSSSYNNETHKVTIKNNIIGRTSEPGWWQLQLTGSGGNCTGVVTYGPLDYNLYLTGSADAPNIIHWGADKYTITSAPTNGLASQCTGPGTPWDCCTGQNQGATCLGWETNGRYANPTFINAAGDDYRLSSNDTSARGRGPDLTPLCSTVGELCYDKNGVARPNGSPWDVGAYEYMPGGDTAPPAEPTGLSVR